MKKDSEKINPAAVRRVLDTLIKIVIAISTCFTAAQM